MLRTLLVTLTLMLALATPAFAITVENVISMHQSGLPAQVIVQTIQSTGSKFDLTVQNLAALETAGVPANVIEAMMAASAGGGDAGGGAAPAPEPGPEPAPEPAPEVDELERLKAQEDADRAKIDEQSRVREAARRAADAERERMAAEERTRVAKALESARWALDDRDYYKAARQFDEFLRQADPSKPSALAAKQGLADALFGLKLYGNAAELYHELLGAGPESDVFAPSFEGLRACAKKVSYNPVTLEALTGYFVGNQPQAFQDSYNYFLGKFFFDYTRHDEAIKYLSAVDPGGEDYPDAQYLVGLVGVQAAGEDTESELFGPNLLKSAGNFEAAVAGALAQDNPRIAHMGYLALARIAYSIGIYDVAIYYYRKVPSESTSYVQALHESGWSYFLKGDTRRGMGIFHTLDSPEWRNYFLPDTYLLEATVFMNACHFDFARDAIGRIQQRYLSLAAPVAKFLEEYASPEALYQAFVLKHIRNGIDLPRLVRMATIADPEFYDLYTNVTVYRREVAAIKKGTNRFGEKLAADLLTRVESRHKQSTMAMGIKLNQLLQRLADELSELEVSITEIQIEIEDAAAAEISKEIEQAYGTADAAQEEAVAQGAALTLVGDKYLRWPFEGEYWADEVNNYRSQLQDVCKAASAAE